MQSPRKMLLLIVALCGVCAVLVMIAANLGGSRPEDEFMAAAPRSQLDADYTSDPNAQRLAPVRSEIAEAALSDSVALGVTLPQAAGASTGGAALPAPAKAPNETGPRALAADTAPSSGSLSFLVTVIAVVLVGALVWGAYYVLRPAAD